MYPPVEASDGQEWEYIRSLTCGYHLGHAVMKSDVLFSIYEFLT